MSEGRGLFCPQITNLTNTTNMNDDKVVHKDLSYQVVGVLYDVYNDLGSGYQEKIYQKALEQYFLTNNIKYKSQVLHNVVVKGKVVGRYYFDFIIDDKIILEIKRGDYYIRSNISQVKGYLAASKLQLAIIANFTSSGVKFFRVLNSIKN